MGKYGTNLEGFGAYEGGVNADKGAPLVSTNSDGATALLFGPAALREIQAGVANGDFAIPPDDATAPITDENPLPYWTLSNATSTVTIESSASAASANVLQFVQLSVGSNAILSRYVAIPGALDRSFSFFLEVYLNSYTAGVVTVRYAWAKSDFTTTGTGGSSSALGFSAQSVSVGGVAPSDASYMYISVESGTAAHAFSISEIRVNMGKQALYITDSDPTITPAKMTSTSGVLTITPATSVKIAGANSLWVSRASVASAAQSLTNNTSTTILLDTASTTPTTGTYDPNSWFSNANDRIAVGQAGFYCVTANIAFAANATGRRVLTIAVNGADVGSTTALAVAVGSTILSVSTNLYLAGGDLVTMTALQQSGGALNTVVVAGVYPALSLGRIGA